MIVSITTLVNFVTEDIHRTRDADILDIHVVSGASVEEKRITTGVAVPPFARITTLHELIKTVQNPGPSNGL